MEAKGSQGVTAAPAIIEPIPRPGSTRDRLLEAAIEMFAERGYAATGVDALCKRAGVAKTGLYWEFQNKVGLLNAVIDQVVAEWVHHIRDASRIGGSPRDRLDAALAAVKNRVQERPEIFRVILVVVAERTQIDEEAREALRRFYRASLETLVTGIQEATGGGIPHAEIAVQCELVLAMMSGLFLREQICGQADFDRLFDGMRSAILLMVREMIANQQGRTTLAGRVTETAVPRG